MMEKSEGQNQLPKLLSYGELVEALGISKSTIQRMVRDLTFPQPLALSPNRVAFVAAEVEDWTKERLANRHIPPEPRYEPRSTNDPYAHLRDWFEDWTDDELASVMECAKQWDRDGLLRSWGIQPDKWDEIVPGLDVEMEDA